MDPVTVDAITQFTQLVTQVGDSYKTLGLVGALGALLTVAIRVVRLPWVQKFLPAKLQWDVLSKVDQVGVVFVMSLVGAAATSLAGGVPWPSALAAGLSAALAAVGLHETTSAVGDAHTAVAVQANPDYTPGAVKQLLTGASPVAPAPVPPTAPAP